MSSCFGSTNMDLVHSFETIGGSAAIFRGGSAADLRHSVPPENSIGRGCGHALGASRQASAGLPTALITWAN